MVRFSLADYLVVGAVLLSFLALGFSARLREVSALQMIAAGRRLTLPLFVATLVTTWYGGILGIGESFDYFGIATYTILAVPYYVFGIIFAVFMAGRVREEAQISLPERFDRCYGRTASVLSALLLLLIAAPAAHIFMLGTLVNLTTQVALVPATILGAVIGTLFLYRGGLLADARSNLVSFVMMYASFGVILVVAVAKYGDPLSVLEGLPAEKREWLGSGPVFVISWFVLGAWTFVDPGFHQRVAAGKDEATARSGVIVSVACWMVFDLLSIATAMYAFSAMGGGHGARLFPIFGNEVLPDGLKGVFFAGMFGVITSAMVGYTLVCGSTLGRDLAARMLGFNEGSQVVLLTRLGIAVATVLGTGLALAIPSVVSLWYELGSIAIPGLLFPTVAAYALRKPLTPGGSVATLVVGSGSAFIWYLLGKRGILSAAPREVGEIPPILAGLIGAALALIFVGAADRRKR